MYRFIIHIHIVSVVAGCMGVHAMCRVGVYWHNLMMVYFLFQCVVLHYHAPMAAIYVGMA